MLASISAQTNGNQMLLDSTIFRASDAPTKKIVYTYDENQHYGKPIMCTQYDLLDGAYENSYQDVYTYTPEGLKDIITSYIWMYDCWIENGKTLYKYDNKGREILQQIIYMDQIWSQFETEYFEGRCVKTEYSESFSGELFALNKTETVFNEDGIEIAYIKSFSAGGSWVYSEKAEYEVNVNGHYIRKIEYKWNGQDWELWYDNTWTLGEDDNVLQWELIYIPENSKWKDVYSYDENNHQTICLHYQNDGSDDELYAKDYIQYDDFGLLTSSITYMLENGKWKEESAEFNYYSNHTTDIYPLEGRKNIPSAASYDMLGKLISTPVKTQLFIRNGKKAIIRD